MNFFKMLRPMRTKMLNCVALLLFLLSSVGVMGQMDCDGDEITFNIVDCEARFIPEGAIVSNYDYTWTVTDDMDEVLFTFNEPIPFFNFEDFVAMQLFVNLVIIDENGTVIVDCTEELPTDCLTVIEPGCVAAGFEISCAQLNLRIEPGELPFGEYYVCTQNSNPQTYIDFDDTNDFLELCYTNINTVLNPTEHIIIKSFSNPNEIICEFDIDFPEDNRGIFLGKICETQTLSDIIDDGLLPPFTINGNDGFPSIYLAGSLDADVNYTFQNINIFTGAGTAINVRPSEDANGNPAFTQIALFDDTYVGPQDECVCIWRGFQVFSNGFLNTNFALFGQTPAGRATIEGAMYGIRTIHDNEELSNPVIVTVNLDLRRNFIGFRATDGPNFHAFIGTHFLGHDEDGNEILQTKDCTSCPVENDLEMNVQNTNFPFLQSHAYAGIFVDGIRGADGIDGALLNMIPTTNINRFENLAVGILVDEANATIQGSEFENIHRFLYENNSGFGIRFIGTTDHTIDQVGQGKGVNNFLDVEHGIFVSSHGSGTIANIAENNMDRVQFGITLSSPNNIGLGTIGNIEDGNVIDNSITINENFGDTDNSQPPYGIALFDMKVDASNYLINDNHVTVDIPIPTQSTGIWIEGMDNEDDDLMIRSDTVILIDGQDGIRLDNWNAAIVNDNEINIEDIGNNLPPTDPNVENFDVGIRVQAGSNNIVNCNVVKGINDGSVAQALLVDGTSNSLISANDMETTNVGLSVQNTSMGTQLVCNEMTGPMATGLLYGDNGMTGDQNNNGNTWIGDFGIGAQHTGSFGTSLFTVHGGNQTPPSVSPESGWFFPLTIFDPFVLCPSCQIIEVEPPVTLDEIDIRVLNEELDGLSDAVKHLLARLLFDKLKKYPNLTIGNPTAQQFLDNHENTIIGLLHQFEKNLQELYKIDVATKTVLENNKIDIQSALAEIRAIDILLASDPMSLLLHGERNNQLSILKTKTAENKAIQNQLQATRTSAADDLLNDLDAMPATANYEVNEKNIYDVYVSTFVKGNSLNTSQNNLVETLAYSCTNVEGPAVHLARSIHSWRTKTPVNSQDCVMETNNNFVQNENGAKNQGFEVYPNPTESDLSIRIPDDYLEVPLILTLVDITGKMNSEVKTTIGITNFGLNITQLPNGIYFLKAYDQSEQVFSTKVIISK